MAANQHGEDVSFLDQLLRVYSWTMFFNSLNRSIVEERSRRMKNK